MTEQTDPYFLSSATKNHIGPDSLALLKWNHGIPWIEGLIYADHRTEDIANTNQLVGGSLFLTTGPRLLS